jgi:hypothetical protein
MLLLLLLLLLLLVPSMERLRRSYSAGATMRTMAGRHHLCSWHRRVPIQSCCCWRLRQRQQQEKEEAEEPPPHPASYSAQASSQQRACAQGAAPWRWLHRRPRRCAACWP